MVSCGGVRRRVAAAAGLLVVLLNILAGLASAPVQVALPARANGESPAMAALLASTLVICTAQGVVVLDADGQPADGGAHKGSCIFCLPLMAGSCPAPDAGMQFAYLAGATTAAYRAPADGWSLPSIETWSARPRAPPRARPTTV